MKYNYSLVFTHETFFWDQMDANSLSLICIDINFTEQVLGEGQCLKEAGSLEVSLWLYIQSSQFLYICSFAHMFIAHGLF